MIDRHDCTSFLLLKLTHRHGFVLSFSFCPLMIDWKQQCVDWKAEEKLCFVWKSVCCFMIRKEKTRNMYNLFLKIHGFTTICWTFLSPKFFLAHNFCLNFIVAFWFLLENLKVTNHSQRVNFFYRTFLEGLINPLQEQIEDWKRGVNTLDKDYAKGKANHS